MTPIGKNIIGKKIKQEQQQGLLILPTAKDYNEFKVLSIGSKVNPEIKEGDILRVPVHANATEIDYNNETVYLVSENDVQLVTSNH
jgi:co-chaperonin GroES (HSP10)